MKVPGPYLGTNNGSDVMEYRGASDPAGRGIDPDKLDLRRIANVFRRRKRLFLSVIAASVIGAAVIALILPRIFTAHADVVLESLKRTTPEVIETLNELPRADADISTELQVLNSRELASAVVDQTNLLADPAFNPRLKSHPSHGLFGLFSSSQAKAEAAPTADEQKELRLDVTDRLRGALSAARIGDSYSFRISFSDPNPRRAAQLANAFAAAYVDDQRLRKRMENRRDAEFLKSRIDELREQARIDDRNVQQYRIDNNMLSTTGASLTEQDISAMNQQLAVARAQAAEDAARLHAAQAQLTNGSLGDDVGAALSSSVIISLRSQRASISAEVAELNGKYGPLHPDLKAAQDRLGDIDKQIQAEIDRVISGLKAQADVSSRRVASLSHSLAGVQAQLARNNRASVELDDLQRRAATSQGLYESYLNAYKETTARAGMENASARVVSEARIPTTPSQPRVGLILLFGALFGVGTGLAASFVAELNFAGLTTGEDVAERLGVAYLGMMPLNESATPRGQSALLTVSKYPNSPLGESVSSLLTSIQFAAERRAQVIYVTSGVPEEGKTTLAAALGLTAAARGEGTVVVDCDRVRRGLQRTISCGNSPGLYAVLAGNATLDDAIVQDPATGCCFVPITQAFPEGVQLNHPADGAFAAFIARLRERFGTVILDGPPILPVAEARELALYADYIVLAVKWRETPDAAVREAIKLLPAQVQGSIGIALTSVNLAQQASYSPNEYRYLQQYSKYYTQGQAR